MIKRIGRCSIGFANAIHEEIFEFEDNCSEAEMEQELIEWANQYLEVWFEEVKDEQIH